MIIKTHPIFTIFARHSVEKNVKVTRKLTHQDWIVIDRIVVTMLFTFAIIAAILFSI
ncbi:hypothetical protein IWX76_001913 [Pedobacter sp. CAN_A7]